MGWVFKMNQKRHLTCLAQPLAEPVLALPDGSEHGLRRQADLGLDPVTVGK